MFLELGSNTYTNISPIPKVELNPRLNNILSSLGNNVLPEFTLSANLGFNNILL